MKIRKNSSGWAYPPTADASDAAAAPLALSALTDGARRPLSGFGASVLVSGDRPERFRSLRRSFFDRTAPRVRFFSRALTRAQPSNARAMHARVGVLASSMVVVDGSRVAPVPRAAPPLRSGFLCVPPRARPRLPDLTRTAHFGRPELDKHLAGRPGITAAVCAVRGQSARAADHPFRPISGRLLSTAGSRRCLTSSTAVVGAVVLYPRALDEPPPARVARPRRGAGRACR